ncbi:hypothetical protein [Membranihabitans marinus]|uniref:hypothetical protein n=1 Tax=Membranihabitans marinus TaxID=1227546 RepID=UPI001F190C1D|nr:hypothetical protein [Membranihabitans marinus]
MKTLTNLFFLILFGLVQNFAQNANSGISYQAVIRNSNNVLVKNANIGLRISILKGGGNGTILYSETQNVKTNPNGLMSIRIGEGMVLSGDFDQLDWSQDPHYLKTEIDPQGGSQYVLENVSALTAVPYAFHAKTADDVDDADADPLNEIQTIHFANHQLSIDQGNTVDLSSLANTDQQVLNYNSSNGELTISGGNSIFLPITQTGDQWGSQTVVVDHTLTGDGTVNNPLSVNQINQNSLWSKNTDNDDIYYNQGQVYLANSNKDKLELDPNNISFRGENNVFTTQLNNGELNIQGFDNSVEARYTAVGSIFSNDENSSLLSSDSLVFRDTFDRVITSYSKDSLFFRKQIGLLYPDVVSIKADKLKYETLYSGLKSELTSGSLHFVHDDFTSYLNSYQFDIWETKTPQPFRRFIASGDSLQLYNAAKWKVIDLQSDSKNGGSIQLFDLSGRRMLSLGKTRDQLQVDGPLEGGRMSLYDHNGYSKINVSVVDGDGYFDISSDTSYMHSSSGQMSFGKITGSGDFRLLEDPNVIFGYDEKYDLGNLRFFAGSNQSPTVFLGSSPFEPLNGQLCLYAGDQVMEKVCALATLDDGGEFRLNGDTFTKFYAGGYDNKGMAYINDELGRQRAGMMINEYGESKIFTRNGKFSIEDENGMEKVKLGRAELLMGLENGFPRLALGLDHFSSGGAAYQLLKGANGQPNVYLGSSGSETYQHDIGQIKLFDGFGEVGAIMDGLGNMQVKSIKMVDDSGFNRFQVGYYFGGSIFAHLSGNTQKPVVVLDAGTDGASGKIAVNDNNGNTRASMYVDPNTGNGHIVAQVKNFREDHPTNPHKEIWYASIEGPEAAIYERGTAQLYGGEVFVPFSEHFKLMFNLSSSTVQLTPKHWDTFGLAVTKITENGFYVKELKGGQGDFAFHWEVKAVRKGYEAFQPIRDKK